MMTMIDSLLLPLQFVDIFVAVPFLVAKAVD